jgi:hypothetical protein
MLRKVCHVSVREDADCADPGPEKAADALEGVLSFRTIELATMISPGI